MPRFVIRRASSFFFRYHDVACGAQLDLLQRIEQIALRHRVLFAAGREQRRLIYEIREIGPGHAGR